MMNYFQHEKALVGKDVQIGEGTNIWAFTNIQDGAKIGAHCNICDGCFIERGSSIGNHVTVKNNVAVFDGIIVEDDVFVGANITFINDRLPRSQNGGQWTLEKTYIRKGATLGAGSVIMCGIEIGENAFIGAGSLVTKNVLPHELWFGQPAQRHGYVCVCGQRLNHDLACACGKTYHLTEKGISSHA